MLAPKWLICLLLLTQIFKYLDSLDVEDSKDVKSGYSITFVSIFRLPFFRCTLFCCFCFWNEFYFFQEQLFNFYLFLLFRCYLSLNLHSWPFIVLLMSYSWSFQFLSFFSLFTLNFQNFKENAHFEDTKLKKTFTFFEEGTAKITGTYIKWNEGMVMLVYYPFGILYTFFSLICF